MRMSFSTGQAFKRIVGKWRQSAVSVTCIGLAFLAFNSFLLLALNLKVAEEKIKGEVQMEVYLADDLTSLQLHMLLGSIRSRPEVEKMEYVSRRDALAQMESLLGDGSLEGLDATALPASLRLSLGRKYKGFEQMAGLASQLRLQEGVEDVEFGAAWLEKADHTSHILSLAVIIFGAMLAVALAITVSHLMRALVRSQAAIIRTMDWLGAGAGEIGAFLVTQGLLLGGAGALAGILLLWLVYSVFTSRVSTIMFLPAPMSLGMMSGGMILGALGVFLSPWKRMGPEA